MTAPPQPTAPTAPPGWLAHFPVPFFASVMGLAGLTLALHRGEAAAGWAPVASRLALYLTIAAFLAIAAIYAVKALRHPDAVADEWRHPVKLAFFPAMSISLLLIAAALGPTSEDAARVVWILGALAQGGLFLAVLSNWIGHRPFTPMHISPAWFIPAVGNMIAPVGGVPLGFVETSWLFYSAGLFFWVILLVLVMNRLIFHDPLPGKMMPTLAILIAPPALAFLSWLQLNGGVLDPFARVTFNGAVVFLALALTQARKLFGLPFALSFWALSFPVAAMTIATFRYADLVGSGGHRAAGFVLLAALAAIVAGLFARTVRGILRHEICVPE